MSAMEEWKAVLDSGARTEFPTGSVRDIRDGKGRYDLIPPRGLRRLAVHFENGAKKYGDRNWEKGQNLHCFLDSAIRHLYAYLEGKRDEDHLAAAAWNAVCAIHTEEMIAEGLLPKELDDLMIGQDKGECPHAFVRRSGNSDVGLCLGCKEVVAVKQV